MAKTKVQVDQGILKRVNSVFNDVKNNSNEQESLNQPYNLFTMWDMSENDHTKLLLSLLRFNQNNGYALIESFMKRFANVNVNEWNIINVEIPLVEQKHISNHIL